MTCVQLLGQFENTGPPPAEKDKISSLPTVHVSQEQAGQRRLPADTGPEGTGRDQKGLGGTRRDWEGLGGTRRDQKGLGGTRRD